MCACGTGARFHDTLSQSQPLRPYTYADTDVDRYQIDGRLRQTLLAPRELDLNQLGDARNRWINRALTFHTWLRFRDGGGEPDQRNRIAATAGSRCTGRGKDQSLKVQRPEIYYGETMDETVFVHTAQPEFNYPSGSSEVNTSYDGKGRISYVVNWDADSGHGGQWRLEYSFDELFDAGQPNDDPPQGNRGVWPN